jgi:TetR/AcrR family transcriptional repressor of nem operon
MRYSKEHKNYTRSRIIEAAGRTFRKQGYIGAGIDGIMQAAGLSHGGFYAHFRSKDELLAEAIRVSMQRMRQHWFSGLEKLSGLEWLRELVERYLSQQHRDEPELGCMMPPLVSELARAAELPRAGFEATLCELVDQVAAKLPDDGPLTPRERALATMALNVGAMALARAVNDKELSSEILAASKKLALYDCQTASTSQ